MTRGDDILHFFYDAANRPAVVVFNGTKYGYVHNLQGDICRIIDASGSVVVQYKYDSWGKVLSTTGSLASTLGTIQPFRYRGYVYDVETGLYYLRSRYYMPRFGRFLNADLVYDSNVFAYCHGNPIINTDLNGNRETNIYAYKATEYYNTSSRMWQPMDSTLIDKRLRVVYDESAGKYYYSRNGVGISFNADQCIEDFTDNLPLMEHFVNEARTARDGKGLILVYDSKYNNSATMAQYQMMLKRMLENCNYQGAEGLRASVLVTGKFDLTTVNATRWFTTNQQPHINFGEENEKRIGCRIINALYLCLYEQFNDGEYQ